MTVAQLLREADSAELTCWQLFLVADAERQKEAREKARQDREYGV